MIVPLPPALSRTERSSHPISRLSRSVNQILRQGHDRLESQLSLVTAEIDLAQIAASRDGCSARLWSIAAGPNPLGVAVGKGNALMSIT